MSDLAHAVSGKILNGPTRQSKTLSLVVFMWIFLVKPFQINVWWGWRLNLVYLLLGFNKNDNKLLWSLSLGCIPWVETSWMTNYSIILYEQKITCNFGWYLCNYIMQGFIQLASTWGVQLKECKHKDKCLKMLFQENSVNTNMSGWSLILNDNSQNFLFSFVNSISYPMTFIFWTAIILEWWITVNDWLC